MRRSSVRGWCVVGAVVAVTATSCGTPPSSGGGAIPECPQRQTVAVELADQVDFSTVRAVSPNGEWILSSKTIAGELELAVRRTQVLAAPMPIGTVSMGTEQFAVADDGRRVVIVEGRNAWRWDADSAALTPIPAPVLPPYYGTWGSRSSRGSSPATRPRSLGPVSSARAASDRSW